MVGKRQVFVVVIADPNLSVSGTLEHCTDKPCYLPTSYLHELAKTRTAVPQARKKALREWYKQQPTPKPSLQDCIWWFEAQYQHRLHKSVVSRYLSASYSKLDGITASSSALRRSKERSGRWPLLETILSGYCQIIRSGGGTLTEDVIAEKARQFWQQIPEYERQSMPGFSNGWVTRFKQRHKLARRALQEEPQSVMAVSGKSYLDLVTECDSFPYNAKVDALYKFMVQGDRRPHGYMLPSIIRTMPWTTDIRINHEKKEVYLCSFDLNTSVNTVLKTITDRAIERNSFRVVHQQHSELYPVLGCKGLTIERYFAPLFGIISRGAHLTVFTRVGALKEIRIWVPRRSPSCFTYPGCLDTTVAGGLPAGESALDCIVREAAEEASLPESLVREKATACGVLSYMQQSASGDGGEIGLVAPDLLYVYDLEVDEDVVCRPCDDEVQGFLLLTVEEVAESLATDKWKTNSAIVMIDFFIRHGIINESNEKHYAELVMRMHRRLPFPTSTA